jgi:hypothetical protein
VFEKTLEAPSGSEASYWHRERVVLNDAGLTIELKGYKTTQAKLDGKPPVGGAEQSFFVGRDRFAELGLPDFNALTRQIVRTISPDFADAADALVMPPAPKDLPA